MRKKGFTLIEILVAVVIMAILAGMANAFFRADYNKQKACASNLRKIYNALEAYRDANTDYPADGAGGLKSALYPAYISDESVFKCPADTSAGTDSYSVFYVKRNDYFSMNTFVLGCPRHENNRKAMNLFFQGQILKYELAPVTSGGAPVAPGDTVTGTVVFADGTTETVTGTAVLVQSFYIGNGKCYNILKATTPGTIIDSDVTAGTRHEIITPSAVAGVGGTFFRVTVDSATKTYIGVTEGTVYAIERGGKGKTTVRDNEVVLVERDSRPVQYQGANKDSYKPDPSHRRSSGKGQERKDKDKGR